ncbi:ABC transporter substrate-binding protein [Hahella ganghwensis]|uniref:ABC transporter substrate-binding protein n=1 Tax=Hahella ganghwensis TaxID=286420 RepID=UPI000475F124|nr:iron-siderophore ABC transporter substrate-binding protein [Hahella ganghwensis]
MMYPRLPDQNRSPFCATASNVLGWCLVLVVSLFHQVTAASERTVEHSMGVSQISGTPTRVVTLFQGATDTAVALGVIPVGVVDSWVEKPTYKYLRKDLQGVSHVGQETQPNLEMIVGLQPDLIVASKRRHEKIYHHLSQIAPTIALETVFDFKETLSMMGLAMNLEQRATQLLRNWENRIDDFQTRIPRKLGSQWPLEVALLNFRADHARIYLKDSYAGSILNDLGFLRPSNHPEGQWVVKLTTKESIPAMNADVFFVFMTADDPAVARNYHLWTLHPLWKNLDAPQNQQVYQVDEVAWNMSGGIIGANLMLDQIYQHFDLSPGA